jgi:hypothetical protein
MTVSGRAQILEYLDGPKVTAGNRFDNLRVADLTTEQLFWATRRRTSSSSRAIMQSWVPAGTASADTRWRNTGSTSWTMVTSAGTHGTRLCVRLNFRVLASRRVRRRTTSTSSALAEDPRWPCASSFPW